MMNTGSHSYPPVQAESQSTARTNGARTAYLAPLDFRRWRRVVRERRTQRDRGGQARCLCSGYDRGFTLIEILTAIAVLAVLLSIAAPSFREMMRRSRVMTAQNDLVTSLNLARSESLKRTIPITVCSSLSGSTCTAAADWASGWIVFTDATGIPGILDSADELLQAWGGVTSDVRVDASGAAFIRFQPSGMIDSPATIEIYADGCEGPNKRRVRLNASGGLLAQSVDCSP